MNDIPTRAGIIPYIIVDGVVKFMMMTPSDPVFGGTRAQIAKGRIDSGDTPLSTAIKEGSEELGLKSSNFVSPPVHIGIQTVSGGFQTYKMVVYAVEVHNTEDFELPQYETRCTGWFTAEQFYQVGRVSHQPILSQVISTIRGLKGNENQAKRLINDIHLNHNPS